jgi:hypothetical protein
MRMYQVSIIITIGLLITYDKELKSLKKYFIHFKNLLTNTSENYFIFIKELIQRLPTDSK